MLQEQENRGTLVAVFGMTAWTFTRIIINGSEDGAPFATWEYPDALRGVMKLISCLLASLIYYPIFCCITARVPIAYVLGTAYCWLFAAYFVVFNLPQVCHDPTTEDARRYLIDVARKVPGLLFIVYICIAITWQSIRSLCVQQSKQETFTDDSKEESYQVSRVRHLLKKHKKDESGSPDSKIIEIIEARIYRNVPGFSYSITILAAATVSITLAYMSYLFLIINCLLTRANFDPFAKLSRRFGLIMMSILEEWWLYSHVLEVEFDKYDELFHDDHPSEKTKVVVLAFLVKMFTALASNESSNGSSEIDAESLNEYKFWFRLLSACAYAGLFFAFLMIVFAMVSTLQSYRRHLIYLRKGCFQKIPRMQSKEPKNLVISSAKFAGFQFGYSSWGYCIQFITITTFLFAIGSLLSMIFRYGYTAILLYILERIGPVFLWIIILKLLQKLLVNAVFLQNGSNDNKVLAINNRYAFFNYQYFMVFTNAPLGLFSCLLRIIKAIVFGIWSLPRLDGSTLSRRFEQYDNGFGAYISLLHLENSVNNPVLVVFVNLLLESRKKRLSRSIQATGYRLEKSLTFLDCKSFFSNRQVIRNRWHLYVTLSNNPALRSSRRSRLDVPTMVSRMIRSATGLHDYLLDEWHYQGYDNPSWHM